MSLFILTAFYHELRLLVGTVVKRIWEAYSMFMVPGLVLMLVVVAGVVGHFNHLYHWRMPGGRQ